MISLRHFQSSDKPRLIEILNNKRVSQFLSSKIPSPYSSDDADWWINEGSKVGYVRAITLKSELIGCIGVSSGEFEYARNGEIGYWLSPESWGKGYATIAVNIVTDEVFRTTEINRLFACVFSANKGSMKVLQKCDYSTEAVLRQAIFKNGKFYDNHIFAKLNNNQHRNSGNF